MTRLIVCAVGRSRLQQVVSMSIDHVQAESITQVRAVATHLGFSIPSSVLGLGLQSNSPSHFVRNRWDTVYYVGAQWRLVLEYCHPQ